MKFNTLLFWAKTSHEKEKPNAFHPLICHLIDVAIVTQKIWQDVLPIATKERIARAFGETKFDDETFKKIGWLVAFIAGLHDLGKCSPPFTLRGKNDKDGKESLEKLILKHEGKDSDYVRRLRGKLQTINFLKIYEPTDFHIQGAVPKALCAPHGYVTTIELPEILVNKRFAFNPKIAEQIAVLIGGHHGVFPNSEWRKNGKNAVQDNLGNQHWENARIELTDTLAELLQIKPIPVNAASKLDNGTIMVLAGLVSVADWIGSDTQFFDCAVDDFTKEFELNLEEYFERSKAKAIKALEKLGWLHWAEVEKQKRFFELFPDLKKYPPRGLQSKAIEIAGDLQTQGIVVIESPMGEGKTEAAMFLADNWNVKLKQRGIYFALPTQATSNQMFGRVKDFLGGRFDKGILSTGQK
jgi:CRISPR-associated endonuclease/helicase Cas3